MCFVESESGAGALIGVALVTTEGARAATLPHLRELGVGLAAASTGSGTGAAVCAGARITGTIGAG